MAETSTIVGREGPDVVITTVPVGAPYDSDQHGDLVLVNGEARFHGHRLLLAIASPVFRALLEGGMAESQQTVVEINEDETHARWFGVMLDHLYPYDRAQLCQANRLFLIGPGQVTSGFEVVGWPNTALKRTWQPGRSG